MKKMLMPLVVLVGLVVPTFAEKLDLGNPNIVENFGATIVKEKLDTYDSVSLGLWFLKKNYHEKWSRVRNDEFELDDAKVWAFDQLKKKLDKAKPIKKGAEYHLHLTSKIEKYDFKAKSFPVKALSENSYMQYKGKNIFVTGYSSSKLLFENASTSVNFIPMEKAAAKKFIKSRKDRYGTVDRNIIAHYVYTITSFSEDREFKSDGSTMTIKFMGKLKSVEFMDKSRKHILYRVDFSDKKQSQEEVLETLPQASEG